MNEREKAELYLKEFNKCEKEWLEILTTLFLIICICSIAGF